MTTATNSYPINGSQELPILAKREEILQAVRENQAVVITAETGAGKSTQVPQYLLELLGDENQIIVTQPRRLAARTVSQRVADELGCELGGLVGYRTAQERADSAATKVLFCTDGLQLVRELTGTGKAQVLVIDEVHEWNLNIEVLVAWARQRIREGSNFKVVLMSATLEAEKLAAFFDNCPVIKVKGRAFPVECRTSMSSVEGEVAGQVLAGRNVLVFQPGKSEIEATVVELKKLNINAEILPLHGGLEPVDQARCFKSYGRPKVVVSTNVAETSVTIPDIDAVVDSGKERRIEVRDGVEGLYLCPISVANTNQRAGRAGRCKEGFYILCSSDQRPEWPTAEIQRSRLDQLVLRLAMAGFDAATLEFFHQPQRSDLQLAKEALKGLGALDSEGKVTEIGRKISKFPVDVHYARMVLEASRLGVTNDVLTVVACLEAGGILHKSGNWRSHFGVKETESDLLAQQTVFDLLCGTRGRIDWEEVGVYGKAYRRAVEVRQHLVDAVRRVEGVDFSSHGSRVDVLKACCAGMVDHLYRFSYEGRFGAVYVNGTERQLGKESVLNRRSSVAKWVVGLPFDLETEVKTGRYRGTKRTLHLVTNVSAVDPAWLPEVAPHLAELKHRNYRWVDERGEVVVDEVTVFNGTEVGTEVVAAKCCPEATQSMANQLAHLWLEDQGKAVNAELAELQAKSGLTKGPLSQSEAAEIFANRLGKIFRVDDPAMKSVDFCLMRAMFVSDEEANMIRKQAPDAVLIGDEVCNVSYKYEPKGWYSEAKQTVTIKVSVSTIQAIDQAAVENLIPSGVQYKLQLTDESYTAISGNDVSKLREEIEARRLHWAWETCHDDRPRVTVTGLEPLPRLPEPKVYDVVTGSLAYPAFSHYYGAWHREWFRTSEEAEKSQAEALKAKAKLDVEEDERLNFDILVAEAKTQLVDVEQLFAQIDRTKFQSYGLSDKEVGKGYWSSDEDLSKKIEQAKVLAGMSYYTAQPVKALELLATIRTRVELALEFFQANETKRPEAEGSVRLIRNEMQLLRKYYRADLLTQRDEIEMSDQYNKLIDLFDTGHYQQVLVLENELSERIASLTTKAEATRRQKEELKKSANDRLRTLLSICPVCSCAMQEVTGFSGQQFSLVCRNTDHHPLERVLWAQSGSGLTQYDYAVLATIRPEGTYKSRDNVAEVKLFTNGTVVAEWYPTDETRLFVRTDCLSEVILTPEAWTARNRERYQSDLRHAEEMTQGGYWFRLQFRQGRHPKTGEPQWEAGTRNVKYVLDNRSQQEPVAGQTYFVSQVKELVNTGSFRLIAVRIEPPFPQNQPESIRAASPAPVAKTVQNDESTQTQTAAEQIAALKAKFRR